VIPPLSHRSRLNLCYRCDATLPRCGDAGELRTFASTAVTAVATRFTHSGGWAARDEKGQQRERGREMPDLVSVRLRRPRREVAP